MPTPIRLLEIDTEDSAKRELDRVRAGRDAHDRLAAKMIPLRVRLGRVCSPAANILKQEMLAAGGDAAVAEGAAACREPASDVILTGSLQQIRRLIRALKGQPFGLEALGARLASFLGDVARSQFTVKTRRGSLRFGTRTRVMAVLNVTPDSFSDGGRFTTPEAAVAEGKRLEAEGADVIDVGGESTRPGSCPVDVDEEKARVLPVIERLADSISIPISIDTMKAAVAAAALRAGASLVNVVGALDRDPELAEVAGREDAGLVLMHMKGIPARMYDEASYPMGVMGEVIERLEEAIELAESRGVDRERIIVDPGLGFGKRASHTLEVLKRLGELRSLGRPILVGPSRKSFIGEVTGLPLAERLPGTAVACAIAVLNGAQMVRVHEVSPILAPLRMAEAVRDSDTGAQD